MHIDSMIQGDGVSSVFECMQKKWMEPVVNNMGGFSLCRGWDLLHATNGWTIRKSFRALANALDKYKFDTALPSSAHATVIEREKSRYERTYLLFRFEGFHQLGLKIIRVLWPGRYNARVRKRKPIRVCSIEHSDG